MRRLISKQRNIKFIWCPHPITIDMRGVWGESSDNLQNGPDGAFLKLEGQEVLWLVQPNADKTAPIGWVKGEDGFDKQPIYISDEVFEPGSTATVGTKDGVLTYDIKELSVACFNEVNGAPDMSDCWIQTLHNISKNYEF